uniref:Steroid 5-alpha reductase C-terminal domain-containing protein n=1 Tax=Globisporangium ultimum (strain ATCC 200006 / CBS 805.95 / DAOM BR144) TaxID=431595 RepID=K3WFG2_GLOUD
MAHATRAPFVLLLLRAAFTTKMTAAHPAPAAPIQKTGFLRNIAGTVITLPVAALVAYYTDLQFYALVIFGIQWVGALAYAVPFQDEHYLDVTGSATYAGVVLLALFKADAPTWRSYLLTAFVILWCVRLGYFLIKRIGEQGSDSRFDAIRVTPVRFFSVWNIQGLWVFLTLLPTLLTIVHGNKDTAVEWVDIVGIVFWVIGFYLEVTADRQKTAFRHNPANKGKFIHTGLWAYSRHPNYLGEILIWLSVYAIAYHVLPTTHTQHITMGFLRNIAGLVLSLSIACAVSSAANLELYAAVCIGIQWLSAFYAVPKQDERFFDLTGSITFATVSLLALALSSDDGKRIWRAYLLTAMVWLWCVRLGTFLYLRIREVGEDTRFAGIRGNPVRFFSVWSIQGLWVFLTALPVLLSLAHSSNDSNVHVLDVVGTSLWVLGYAIEVTADHQKTQFRHDERNKGKFIQSGLWKYSRHPNYCGEILMWIAIFLIAVHTLAHRPLYQALAALGPVFVTLLLTKVSGIPLLEKQGDERWGNQQAYKEYKQRTSVLLLWPPSKK